MSSQRVPQALSYWVSGATSTSEIGVRVVLKLWFRVSFEISSPNPCKLVTWTRVLIYLSINESRLSYERKACSPTRLPSPPITDVWRPGAGAAVHMPGLLRHLIWCDHAKVMAEKQPALTCSCKPSILPNPAFWWLPHGGGVGAWALTALPEEKALILLLHGTSCSLARAIMMLSAISSRLPWAWIHSLRQNKAFSLRVSSVIKFWAEKPQLSCYVHSAAIGRGHAQPVWALCTMQFQTQEHLLLK